MEDSKLSLKTSPPLDPAWLAHEKEAGLLDPKPTITDPIERRNIYAQKCRDLNTLLLTGRDKYLTQNIKIQDIIFTSIPVRIYTHITPPPTPQFHGPKVAGTEEGRREDVVIIYYHGGGLTVGDLDSEDLTCRRISHAFPQITVYSVAYRLLPEFTADDALADAIQAFENIMTSVTVGEARKVVLIGSSSGGQLAAQVSQLCVGTRKINGVLLRCPVTCDATDDGNNLEEKWRGKHRSMSSAFHTSLLSTPALNSNNRTTCQLPLEVRDEEMRKLRGMKYWVQVCTNDIYYSDGVCYAQALEEAGVEVKSDVVRGWPHTFWLKAPLLDRAVQAENDMLEGLKWLIESE